MHIMIQMILWSEWYNVPNDPNDTMILMIQCTKWFVPNNTMVWLIDKKWISCCDGKWSKWSMSEMPRYIVCDIFQCNFGATVTRNDQNDQERTCLELNSIW